MATARASLLGTFGRVEIAVPRARLDTAEGKTTEWKSRALRAYQRRTKQADSLIAGAYLAGTIQSICGHHGDVRITGNQAAVSGLGETVLNNHYEAETDASGGGSPDEHAGPRYDPDLPGSDPAADSVQDFSGNNSS